MLLSIIIPVYNASKYLDDCLESVKKCPYKEWECILVNDGSTDESLKICKKYNQNDDRFLIINKKNEGVSSARNDGIVQAMGKYLMFLDADDYMDEKAWIAIWKEITEGIHEFVAYSYYTLYDSGRIVKEEFEFHGDELTDYNAIQEYMMASSKLNMCWGKLFCTETIKKHHILFRKDLKIGEDYIFVSDYFQNVKKCKLDNLPILYYRQHAESAMKKYDMRTRLKYMQTLFQYNKNCVIQLKNDVLLSKMYMYYLRMITNLFLEFAKYHKSKELYALYEIGLQEKFVLEVLNHVDSSLLPSKLKGMEYRMLKKKLLHRLVCYFRLKAKIALWQEKV